MYDLLNNFSSGESIFAEQNRQNKSSSTYFLNLNYYILGVSAVLMFFVGIVTNILNLLILSRKSMKSTTNKYLSALAICDLFVLVFSQLSLSNSFINDYEDTSESFIQSSLISQSTFLTNQSSTEFKAIDTQFFNLTKLYHKWTLNIYPRVYPYTYPLAIMFQFGTVWINLGMSTDRFIAIHFPLKSLKFCTVTNAKKLITIIFVFSFLYSIPRFFEYQTKMEPLTINNITETYEFVHNDLTRMGKSNLYRKIVYVYMYIVLQSVVPLIILSVINLALILSLKESNKLLKKFSEIDLENSAKRVSSTNSVSFKFVNKEVKRKDITIMLITVVVVFIVLQSPAVICNCFYGFNMNRSSFRQDSYSFIAVCHVGNFFILTCSATNFFTYCVFNKRFRRELIVFMMRLFCVMNLSAYKKFYHKSTTQNSFMFQSSSYFKTGQKKSFKQNELGRGVARAPSFESNVFKYHKNRSGNFSKRERNVSISIDSFKLPSKRFSQRVKMSPRDIDSTVFYL